MSKWPTVALESLADPAPGSIAIGPFGSRMKADTYVPSGVPVIRGTNISNSRLWKGDWVYVSNEFAETMPNCIAIENDLVFPHRGSIGEVAIVHKDAPRYYLSTSLMKFRPDTTKVNPLYLYYYFRSRVGRAEILRFSSQVGTPGIGQPLSSLRQFRVPLPSRTAQDLIATLLALIDDKIALNSQTNESLEATARAIFTDWFINFGPTRAKSASSEPYLKPDLWALFPERMDDEADLPKGWRTISLGDAVQFNPSEPLTKGEHAPYLEMSNLPTQGPVPELPVSREFTSGTRFRNGDTLLARITPCLENGKACFVQILGPGEVGWGSTEFIVMRSRPPVPPCFTYLVARDPAFKALAVKSMTGTSGRQRARTEALESYPFCSPPEKVWTALASLLTPIFETIAANGTETNTLALTRDLLLPRLISGEVRLRDADKLAGDVL